MAGDANHGSACVRKAATICGRHRIVALSVERRRSNGDMHLLVTLRRAITFDSSATVSRQACRRVIPWRIATIDSGNFSDRAALRHTFGSLLAKAGVAPRVAMSMMRRTDLRLTMNTYTDPKIFDMAGAVEKLTALQPIEQPKALAMGTDDVMAESQRTISVTSHRLK